MLNHVYALLLAMLIDLTGINIPNKFHPVAWMGWIIGRMQRYAPHEGKARSFIYGGLLSFIGMFSFAAVGFILQNLLEQINPIFSVILEGCLISLFFSVSGLSQAANQIYQALHTNDLKEAQSLLSWHLVSRDTSTLDGSQVAAAAIESIAENTSDSFIAPVFYFLTFGLPGILVYRFANTADALLGYHTLDKEWLGKIPARLDDLLNLIPARITALLLFISSVLDQKNVANAISVWWKDRYKTASPNAGQPMSVMAGALDIELCKTGHYCLGEGGRQPDDRDILKVKRLMYLTYVQVFIILVIVIISNELLI
jgi:adenosylcobinamide-phosphate synthase